MTIKVNCKRVLELKKKYLKAYYANYRIARMDSKKISNTEFKRLNKIFEAELDFLRNKTTKQEKDFLKQFEKDKGFKARNFKTRHKKQERNYLENFSYYYKHPYGWYTLLIKDEDLYKYGVTHFDSYKFHGYNSLEQFVRENKLKVKNGKYKHATIMEF